jgi:hypothetical protein
LLMHWKRIAHFAYVAYLQYSGHSRIMQCVVVLNRESCPIQVMLLSLILIDFDWPQHNLDGA